MRPTLLRRALPFLPGLLCAAFMFWLSSQTHPLPFLPRAILAQDKILHAIEYATFAALVAWPLRGRWPRRLRMFLLAAAIASAYGASDELHQAFVPGREADPLDWLADTVGGIIGAAAVARWSARRREAAPP